MRLARLSPFHFVDVAVRLYRLHGKNQSLVIPHKKIWDEWTVIKNRYQTGSLHELITQHEIDRKIRNEDRI